MLEANKSQVSRPRELGTIVTHELSRPDRLAYAIRIARRQIWVVLLFAMLGSGLGTLFFVNAVPKFTATATLLIETQKIEVSQQPVFAEMPIEQLGAMDSQVEVLKSDEIALAVIKKLGLVDSRYILTRKTGFVEEFLDRLFARPRRLPTAAEQLRQLLRAFENGLTVSRLGNSYAIQIWFESQDAGFSAKVANAVADAYIDHQRTSEYNSARQANDWLENRIKDLRGQIEAAQRGVIEFKQQNNIIETDKGLINDQRLVDLNAQVNAAHRQTIDAKARFDQFDTITRADPTAIADASIGNSTNNELINKLRSQYFALASQEADAFTKYGSNNPAIISLRNQKTKIISEMLEEFQHLKESARIDYEAAVSREAAFNKEYAVAASQSHVENQTLLKLRQAEASVRAYQDLYNTLLNRYNASIQQITAPVNEASVITWASPDVVPSYKKAYFLAALFPIAGLALGVGVALLREWLAGRVFLTSKSVDSHLGLSCISVLPRVESPKKPWKPWRRKQAPSGGAVRTVVRGDKGVSWTVVDNPFSRFSDGVRSIKVALDVNKRAGARKIIGFTSAIPNEGKSTIALAVGQHLARNGSRVIVVDCDFRNPSLTRATAPGATSGILELNFGETSLEEAVWRDRTTQMDFLPAVPRPGPPDPQSILGSVEMKRVFDELRSRYEYVIVDLSPLLPVIDVCATTELIDAYLLVIEWNHTRIEEVDYALCAAPEVSDFMLGAVLNKADLRRLAKYDPYVGGYFYGYQHQQPH